ncbi:MAG: histidine phosphatase family protein [Candidatus Neomarinimicrobiota bacterium]|jgi:phosphohistidine phosphatase|nr:histidine phosphatase family protein [Candidatus Neomarinimicrobiota bacterium]|tara:strand:+ start:339 stop:833 length:495 start_codon:yes stop_codon:yes gene_type:complete
MKSIILFRHGKSEWNTYYDSDHNRPLAPRGIKSAKKMGIFLSNKNQMPDLVISSTAVRARSTVELAMAEGNWPSAMVLESAIYGGPPTILLSIAQSQIDPIKSICFVGHEPNFSMFISQTCGLGHVEFTTANMAKIDFNVNNWKDVEFGKGTLDWLQKPKELDY